MPATPGEGGGEEEEGLYLHTHNASRPLTIDK